MGRKASVSFAGRLALLAGMALLSACSGAPARPVYDTLAVLQDRDVEGLDPHTAGSVWQTQTVLANLYEGLVGLDAGMRVQPALALQWANPDDLTLELRLRPGVTFHDGSPLTASDVAYSLDRARSHPRSVLHATLANVSSVEVAQEDRIRIHTLEPDASFVSRLREVAVLSRRCVEAAGPDGLERTSCGTGAYRLQAHAPGLGVDLVRFEGHWAGPPAIPKARFLARSYGDPSLESLLTAGTRVVFFTRPGTPLFERAQREAVLHLGSGLGVSYLGFDLRHPENPAITLQDGSHRNPFLDRRVRQAVALAIDHDDVNRRVYDGRALIASQLVPGVVFGFDRSLPAPRQDLAAARELLAQTPFRDGFRVRLDVRRMMMRYAAPLPEHLKGLGIEVQLELLEEEEFFRRLGAGEAALYVLRFSCRSGDAQELLDKWVHSKGGGSGLGTANHSYDRSPLPGLDAEIDEARRELLPQRRLTLLGRILARVNEERLAVPLLQDQDLTFASPEVEWHPRADTFRIIREARFRSE
jgi:peptide/nickel transport system substrate-binding protein